MVTRTEVSVCSEPRTTWHTYSPESAGDTWCSLSRGPWVYGHGVDWELGRAQNVPIHPL